MRSRLRAESSSYGNGLLGPERREHPAHAPLVSRAMLADVPLTGLSFVLDRYNVMH
jgi:hypothetical protein